MAGDVVEVIVLRKGFDENDRFVYPQKAAEFAVALKGVDPTSDERSHLEAIFRQLLDKVGL